MPINLASASVVTQASDLVHELASHLGSQFVYASTPSNAYELPADISKEVLFKPAIVPGTITQLIENTADATNLDAQDHWLKTQFDVVLDNNCVYFLQFDGLLTHADVFLNGLLIVQSRNAFHTNIIEVSKQLKNHNQLHICFRAIAPLLVQKQPRARFPTRLVNQRHLRFIRTPTLGYMPGFASEAKLVGAFRSIKLISKKQYIVQSLQVNTVLIGDKTGQVSVKLSLKCLQKNPQSGFIVLVDELSKTEILHKKIKFDLNEDLVSISASFKAENIEAYWPHTHGPSKRYLLKLVLDADTNQDIVLGKVGFRNISRANPNNFALLLNNVALFLRGACWTPMNPESLQTSHDDLRQRLLLLKQAGINMLRLPGNMPYECDDFYEICDDLGILIMQDFAFTNFDYPEDNADFLESVKSEAAMFLAKHGNRACLTVLAGNSEVAQQASMMGLDLENIHNSIFDETLKFLCAENAPNVPYVSSSPNSNHIPFHAGNGTSHYYGVGGYKRTYDDARLFKGKFIAECLAFSHVPEDASLNIFFDGESIPTHHPRWKDAVPRDVGSGWDFADITDFYVEKLFDVNLAKLRAIEPQRYLEYCRVASAEVVERTMSIFRADSAQSRTALVWFLHDLKPGAGWGYIDSLGKPKSAFYGLARAAQMTTILFVDEGLDGMAIYLAHDGADAIDCQLEVALINADGQIVEHKAQPCTLAPRSVKRISVDAFLGRFVDSSYAYQFGARSFIASVAKLTRANGELVAQKIVVDPIVTQEIRQDLGLRAEVRMINESSYELNINVDKPAFFVTIDTPFYHLSDNYFHVMPGFATKIVLKSDTKQALQGRIRTFNTKKTIPITSLNLCN